MLQLQKLFNFSKPPSHSASTKSVHWNKMENN